MKRIFPSILLYAMWSSAMATNLQSAVDTIINHVDPAINMGVVVVDLNTGETLYQRNPTRAFVPASNMKLFSDAAALMALGPDYRFKSQLTTNAPLLDNGVLKGSIYLHLSGDPSLTQSNLDRLLSQLPLWGVSRIEGNVVLVSNNSTVSAYAPGRMATDNKYSYGAPIAPLVLDENRLTVTVNPAYRSGTAASVELNNKNYGIVINNQVKTASTSSSCGVDLNMDSDNHLTVRGCVSVGQWAVQQRIPIRNPLRYTQDLVRQHLTNLNIKLDGQVILGTAPASSLLLSSHVSKPINQIMADTLKPSDNLYADSLFLHAAAKLYGAPLNWEQAQPVVKKFLQQQTGISLQSAVLTDGSGLSRNDLLTAQQTVELLRFLHNRFPLAYEYIAALPIAGQDGTLRRRFRKPSQQGLLRAKTGTMTGVMSLSGYLYTANSHTLAFAIFINKTPGTKPSVSGRYRSLIDTLCDFFLRQKPDNHQIAHTQSPNSRVAFQQQPTQADRQRSSYAKWRQLESAVKRSLQGQSVTVLFRGDQLVLEDNDADINKVWTVLQTLRKKYPFTVALHSKSTPSGSTRGPFLLWVKTENKDSQAARTWTLRESVG
jgi:D-alanyl-D-alanine carboxypeptidase/D-alanyl-D-alanine-endopeptidase (penicillin-binding protein 4)